MNANHIVDTGDDETKKLETLEELIKESEVPGFEELAWETKDFLDRRQKKLDSLRARIEEAQRKKEATIAFFKETKPKVETGKFGILITLFMSSGFRSFLK